MTEQRGEIENLAQAAGMLSTENVEGTPGGCGLGPEMGSRETNGACAQHLAVRPAPSGAATILAGGLVPEESSGRCGRNEHAHETPPAVQLSQPARMTAKEIEFYARKTALWDTWLKLKGQGHTYKTAAPLMGIGEVTLWRLIRDVDAEGKKAFESARQRCGRKPAYQPTLQELACVQEIYVRLDESEARGRGLGSSKITAYRLAAKSDDPRISDEFRGVVLKRRHKTVPPSWERLLDTPASVLDRARDKRSTMSAYVSTPRGRTYVNTEGMELPMRAGTIFEADDGTLNFYAYIPWPFGGDKCSDKFGVKLGRWQLLPVVDARWEFCPLFDIVARNLGSYRGEDSGCLIGRAMLEICKPDLWRLERGSWESLFVRDALKLCQVPVMNAWHSKQKNAVERFFDRLWTPLSLIPGHVGRDRGRYKTTTDLAQACMDGRRDPREHFLALTVAVAKVSAAVAFVNSEPIESKTWGTWVPQERFESQMVLADGQGAGARAKLDPALAIFFSREQRVWTVRGACVGGPVEGPLIRFPVYFQCAELWEFEGCRVKCYFDPYADQVTGTLVLQDDWRSAKAGYVIARDVPALDLPPQAVLTADGADADAKSLAIRKAISKAVRTECWNWLGRRSSSARDGMGNVAEMANGTWQMAKTGPTANLQIENRKFARTGRATPVVNAEDLEALGAQREVSPREIKPAYTISEEDMNELA